MTMDPFHWHVRCNSATLEMKNRAHFVVPAVLASLLAAGQLSATVLTFDEPLLFEHGIVVSEQYAFLGVHISANNYNRNFDLATAFDPKTSDTKDPDLQWEFDGGNAQDTVLDNVLVLSERDDFDEGIVDRPDDEGGRVAGELIFDFDQVQSSIGFHVLDVERGPEVDESALLFYLNNVLVDSVPFAALPGMTPGIAFEDNYANVVNPFAVSEYNRAVFVMGGSGAIDNVVFGIPEPSVWLLFGLSGLSLFVRRRDSRSSTEISH